MTEKRRNKLIVYGSMIAMVIAFVAGLLARAQEFEWVGRLSSFLEAFATIWIIGLLVLVVPLICSYLVSALISLTDSKELGRVGAYAFMVHMIILVLGSIYCVGYGYSVLELFGEYLPSLATEDPALTEQDGSSIEAISPWMKAVMKYLSIVVVYCILLSIVIGFVLGRFFSQAAEGLTPGLRSVSDRSMVWMQKYFVSLPVAVMAFIFPMIVDTGMAAIGVAGSYIVLVSICLIIAIGLLYVAVYLFGAHPLKLFVKSMIPAQIVAVSTRSSMATLPSLMEIADQKLDVPPAVTAVIIPFFLTLLRTNKVVSTPFKFMFLAYVSNVPLDGMTLLTFVLFQIVTSFGSPGIPSGNRFLNMSLYIAAGIPLEGYLLLKAVDAIPDLFKTAINATEPMVLTTIVAKRVDLSSVLKSEKQA